MGNTQSLNLSPKYYQNAKNQQNISEFIKYFFSENEYKVFLIQFESYQKLDNENDFTVFERITSILPNNSNEKVTQNPKDVLKILNRLFITHKYQKIPTTFNKQYLAKQIEFYMKNQHMTIARFHGFCMTDSKNRFIPTVLTDRPIKGPLSSLFEKESVTSEQKFCMICGILDAIRLIHKNKFVHLNLNPSTIYIDENLQVKVCDYIFVPTFDISIEIVEGYSFDDDEWHAVDTSYNFSLPKKPALNQ